MPSDRDFAREATRETVREEALKRWIEDRIAEIHRRVSASDVLSRNGVNLKYGGSRSEQMFCPFHGNSRTMAAKYHPADARSNDHVWCFVCQKQWDAIALWKKFAQHEGRFTALLREIEREYGIEVAESPLAMLNEDRDDEADLEAAEVQTLLDVCNRRLIRAKRAFEMQDFFKLSVALDRLQIHITERSIPADKAKAAMATVLDKIGQRERSCHEG